MRSKAPARSTDTEHAISDVVGIGVAKSDEEAKSLGALQLEASDRALTWAGPTQMMSTNPSRYDESIRPGRHNHAHQLKRTHRPKTLLNRKQ